MKRTVINLCAIVAATTALSACTTPYSCKMGRDCINMDETYQAAKDDSGNKESVITTQKRKQASKTKLENKKYSTEKNTASWNPYAGGKMDDKPLYLPPHPIRIWIAPWQQEGDNGKRYLLSGQFLYVEAGGGWQMGQLNEAGSIGGMMLSPYTPIPKDQQRVAPNQTMIQMQGNNQ